MFFCPRQQPVRVWLIWNRRTGLIKRLLYNSWHRTSRPDTQTRLPHANDVWVALLTDQHRHNLLERVLPHAQATLVHSAGETVVLVPSQSQKLVRADQCVLNMPETGWQVTEFAGQDLFFAGGVVWVWGVLVLPRSDNMQGLYGWGFYVFAFLDTDTRSGPSQLSYL